MARTTIIEDPARPRWDGPGHRPLRVHVWQPEVPGPHPAVLLSHGTGGAAADLSWLAESLAAAGVLVAGVDHHGNTRTEEYLPEGFAFVWERPRDLTILLDHVLDRYDVDAARVGVAGFSLGGYTAIALLGGRIDSAVAGLVIRGAVPMPPLPEFPDLVTRLRASWTDEALAVRLAESGGSVADGRIRAGYAIAPSIGELVDVGSLGRVDRPLRIAWGDADDNAFPDRNALRYLAAVPSASGLGLGPHVGHYDFLGHAPEGGDDARSRVAADAVAFFERTLG